MQGIYSLPLEGVGVGVASFAPSHQGLSITHKFISYGYA
jgi:hypothetical protein